MSASGPDLVLYKRDDCPFCAKVFTKLKELGRELPMRDVAKEAGAREELVARGGRGQVPCLVIDGEPMYESDAIVAYLDRLSKRS